MTRSEPPAKPSLPRVALMMTAGIAVVILWGTLKAPGSGTGGLPINDKVAHAVAFALLVLPLSLAAPKHIPKLVSAALVFGAAIEFVQPSFGRSGDLLDWVADAAGVFAGVLPGWWRHRSRQNTVVRAKP